VGVGIHPQLIGTHEAELGLFEEYLAQTRFVGEVGLDAGPAYYQHYPSQKAVFRRVLQLCKNSGGKILSVHAIRAAKDVLDAVESHLAATSNRVVLHWFSGSAADALRAIHLGCYFSINSAMLTKPEGNIWIDKLPRSRLLTETDGPFTRQAAGPSKPADVASTSCQLASRLGLSPERCLAMLRDNLRELESCAGL
jgi:TatD DNase family protein